MCLRAKYFHIFCVFDAPTYFLTFYLLLALALKTFQTKILLIRNIFIKIRVSTNSHKKYYNLTLQTATII